MKKMIFFFTYLYIAILLASNICNAKKIHKNEVNLKVTSNSLSKYINTKQNPCDNFYEFTCGKWKGKHRGKFGPQKNEDGFSTFVKNVFDGKVAKDNKVMQNLKKMYKKCLMLKDEELLMNCILKVENFGLYGYVSLFVRHVESNKKNEDNFKFVKKMVSFVLEEFKKLLDEKKDILDEKTKKNYFKKIKNIKLDRIPHKLLKDVNLMGRCYSHFKFLDKNSAKDMMKNIDNYASSLPKKDKKFREKCIEFIVKGRASDVPLSLLISENAFYDSKTNKFIINPMMLKDPYFDIDFPLSLNYGSLGFVIGHELMHSLDYFNINLDHKGKMNPNMTSLYSLKQYQQKANCFVKQYGYKEKDILKLKMEEMLRLKEDIADNGGIKVAYNAYKSHLKISKKKEPKIPGFEKYTNEQLFFMNFGRIFCGRSRSHINKPGGKRPIHNFEKIRISNTLGNFKTFSKVFNCKDGTSMNPKNRCELWL